MPRCPLGGCGRVGAGLASAGNPDSLRHALCILFSVLLTGFQLSKK